MTQIEGAADGNAAAETQDQTNVQNAGSIVAQATSESIPATIPFECGKRFHRTVKLVPENLELLPSPPALVKYACLAEIYEWYVAEYVSTSPIEARCGCRVHCYEHHFIHMVKLNLPGAGKLWFPDEKAKILNTREGFGEYTHDALRARRLLYALECLRNPDSVTRPDHLKTADRAYIKEFDSSAAPYPFTVVLVRKEDVGLTLCTAQPVRRTDIKKWKRGHVLWTKTV